MVQDKFSDFKNGFCLKLFSTISTEFGNTLPSLLSMAGANYAIELNAKYKDKSVDFKIEKFVEVMKSYDIPITASHENINGNDLVKIICDKCVFDILGSKNVSFCSYSESFFRKYFNAKKIDRIKRDNENVKCSYIITL